jgi:hypothetical protein
MADITVKKDDGTTNVTYSKVVASGGDSSPSLWKDVAAGPVAAFRPSLSLKSEWNGPKSARRLFGEFRYPVTAVSNEGKEYIADHGLITFVATLPQGMHDTELAETVSQGLNLFNSTLVKDSLKSGYAPT